jgi:prolipoprotein diacylglyceryltransferase
MRPHLVHWLDSFLPGGIAAVIAPTWFTCVGLAGAVTLLAMLAIARRHRVDAGAVASAVLWCYVTAVAAGIAVPAAIDAAEQLLATGRVQLRWAGMTSFWGYLAGGCAVAAVCRAHGVPLPRFADLAVAPLGAALVLARLGCFVAGCDYGKVTAAPWALRFPSHSPAWQDHVQAGLISADRAGSLPVHPTQLYEAALGLAIAAIAIAVARTRWARRGDGRVFVVAAALYAIGRIAIEDLRGDAGRGIYLGLSSGQIFSALVLAVIAAAIASRRIRPLAAPATAAALALALLTGSPAHAQPAPQQPAQSSPSAPQPPTQRQQPAQQPAQPAAQPRSPRPQQPAQPRQQPAQPPAQPRSPRPQQPAQPRQQPLQSTATEQPAVPQAPAPVYPPTPPPAPQGAPADPYAAPGAQPYPGPQTYPGPQPYPAQPYSGGAQPSAERGPGTAIHIGALVGGAAPFNRRRDQVAALGGASLSIGLTLRQLGVWIDLDSFGNRDASHGTLLLSGGLLGQVSGRVWLGGRIGLGATLVNFQEAAFRDVAGTTARFEALIDVRLADAWSLLIRPIALDVLTAADLGGPIATWQARIGVEYRFAIGRRSGQPVPMASAAPAAAPPVAGAGGGLR